MSYENLKQRTKDLSIRVIRMTSFLPNSAAGRIISGQIIRSATSVAANYRSACRARSQADFISKIKICEEEADETLFWLEIIEELELVKKSRLTELMKEVDEIIAILVSSAKTARKKLKS